MALLNWGVLKECHSSFKDWVGAGVALKILQIYIEECHSWNFERIFLEIIIKKFSTDSCAIILSLKAKCNGKFDSNYYKYYYNNNRGEYSFTKLLIDPRCLQKTNNSSLKLISLGCLNRRIPLPIFLSNHFSLLLESTH